ncbi:MAG: sigma factor-like helix-turn-helix DNA-binding protein [Anaeromyxobacteraceae bacterium]
MPDADGARRAVQAVFRLERARLVASLTRLVRDVGAAEELAQDALVAALEQWPRDGVPERPGAWLLAAARRRGLDALRHRALADARHGALALEAADGPAPVAHEEDPRAAGDALLGLVLVACHPVLSLEARVALTLRLLCGLETDEIARAFLVPPATVAQRIVRAKRTLAEARVPFEVPRGAALAERLPAALQVVYLVFNEGHAATAGEDLMRPALCDEALRLGRVLAGLAPDEPEVHGLVALMELTAARARARTGPDGAAVSLLEQDRGRWDRLLAGRGRAALERARALGGARGPYALQAAIAAEHARAPTAAATDWPRIAALYDALAEVSPSPVVELNRAMAIGLAYGPADGLALVEALRDEAALEGYPPLPAARGELLERLGRRPEAAEAFALAAALTRNARERAALLDRAARAARP